MDALPSVHDDPLFVAGSAPCVASGDGSHDLRVMGYLPGGRRPGLDCDRPLRWVCLDCSAVVPRRCDNHRASKCVPCSWRYGRRVTRVAHSGAAATDGSLTYFLTLTAPGRDDHAEYDPNWVRRRSGGSSRRCACHRGVDLADWNSSAGACWNRLRTALSRDHADLAFFRAAEVQKRGAIHHHVIVRTHRPLDVLAIQRQALAAGYGCVVDLVPCDAKRHAYYVAKYVTKGCDDRDHLPWRADVVDEHTGEVRRLRTAPTYRSWSASRNWGCTMRDLTEDARRRALSRAHDLAQLQPASDVDTPLASAGVHVAGPAPPDGP